MANLNKVMLMGNLTRDPEVRYTPKAPQSQSWASRLIAFTPPITTRSARRPLFVDVTLWGRTAEIAGEYLKKRPPRLHRGPPQLDSWDDKQTGQKRSKLKVVGEAMQLIGSRGGGEGGGGGGGEYSGGGAPAKSQAPGPAKPKPPVDPDLEPDEDDIPF